MKTLEELRVLIVGLGQIGGSLGLDLMKRRLVSEVVGIDADKAVSEEAARLGVVDRPGASPDDELPLADLVIMAAPIREITRMIPYAGRRMAGGAAILDVGSTKSEILEAAAQIPASVEFVGGHPMAGTEHSGLSAAGAGRFEGTTFVIVPSRESGSGWTELIRKLVTAIGARPLVMTAEEHDRMIALTSNLPHLLAVGLARLTGGAVGDDDSCLDLVGRSLRSATRVAASSPQLTLDMFLTNRENILRLIDRMVAELDRWKGLIERGDEARLKSLIEDAERRAKVIRNG